MTLRISLTVVTCVLTIGLAGEAKAHAHLKSATPAMGGTVTAAPAELDLAFSEGVNPRFTGLTMTGPAGAAVATGPSKLGPGGDATLVVPVTGTLGAGTYKVVWHALATDGHKTDGAYTFTVKP